MNQNLQQSREELARLITHAKKIAITSHLSPDPDAVLSLLAAYNTLVQVKGEENVDIYLADNPGDNYAVFSGFAKIINKDVATVLDRYDLLIVLDIYVFERFTRQAETIREIIKRDETAVVVIDHHGKDVPDADICAFTYLENASSTCELLYKLFFEGNFSVDEKSPIVTSDIRQQLLVGILLDSQSFKLPIPNPKESLRIYGELLPASYGLEEIVDKISTFDSITVKIIGHIIKNLVTKKGYCFAYLSDEDFQSLRNEEVVDAHFTRAYKEISNIFLKKIRGANAGFVVIPQLSDPGKYYVSMRAINDYIDVSAIAKRLSPTGGGHKGAAASLLDSESVIDVVSRVEKEFAVTFSLLD